MLRINNIGKSIDGLEIISDLSLEVKDGEILALIGPSGCGKTTLLNIISGLMTPDMGNIEKDGIQFSYMFQNSRLLPWKTVYKNIALGRRNSEDKEIKAIIKSVGLEGFENYYPDELSGGMAKRVALARAFYRGGNFLLMDEPFQGLDYGIRIEMIDLLLSIWKKDKPGVIFITHEIDEALMIATRIALLDKRPTKIRATIDLPGEEGRDSSSPELQDIRIDIVKHIVGERSYDKCN